MPTAIGLSSRYRAWHSSGLGQITEGLERNLLLELAGPVEGKSVLDLGCGDGRLLSDLQKRGALAQGIDADPEMVAQARASNPALDIQEGDAANLPYADGSFDLVIANTLLCLVANRAKTLFEAARVLKPGGRFVIGELGRYSLWAAIRRVKGWLGSGLWRNSRFSSSTALRRELERAGLAVTATRGAVFYPPWSWAARLVAPFDCLLGHQTTFGAAYIATSARKPYDER